MSFAAGASSLVRAQRRLPTLAISGGAYQRLPTEKGAGIAGDGESQHSLGGHLQ